jgi:hypothetical protein
MRTFYFKDIKDKMKEEELIIEGNLNLSCNKKIVKLPKIMKIKGFLDLSECRNLKNLPEILEVGGAVDLSWCFSLEYLPKIIIIGKDFGLNTSHNLKDSSEGVEIEVYLDVDGSGNFPSNPKVSDWVNIKGCYNLKKIPISIQVKQFRCSFGMELEKDKIKIEYGMKNYKDWLKQKKYSNYDIMERIRFLKSWLNYSDEKAYKLVNKLVGQEIENKYE